MPLNQQQLQELEELRSEVQRLEAELNYSPSNQAWPPKGFYLEYSVSYTHLTLPTKRIV